MISVLKAPGAEQRLDGTASGFDAMAIVVDWLDAYRTAQLDTMLELYEEDASVECGCGGAKILVGKAALRQYTGSSASAGHHRSSSTTFSP